MFTTPFEFGVLWGGVYSFSHFLYPAILVIFWKIRSAHQQIAHFIESGKKDITAVNVFR